MLIVKKKVCIVILILAIIGLLTGISYLVEGIGARGFGGVNYGRVIFPLLIGVIKRIPVCRMIETEKRR